MMNLEKYSFDPIFVYHILEHLSQSDNTLAILKELINIGEKITVIEGDHRSVYFYPVSTVAQKTIQC